MTNHVGNTQHSDSICLGHTETFVSVLTIAAADASISCLRRSSSYTVTAEPQQALRLHCLSNTIYRTYQFMIMLTVSNSDCSGNICSVRQRCATVPLVSGSQYWHWMGAKVFRVNPVLLCSTLGYMLTMKSALQTKCIIIIMTCFLRCSLYPWSST